MKNIQNKIQSSFNVLKGLSLLVVLLVFSSESKANRFSKDNQKLNEAPKREVIVWCEVRGLYTKFTGYDGVLTHVCSFVSTTDICYYVPCGVMRAEILPKMKPAFQPPVSIEQTGDDFYLLVPNKNGYEVIPMPNPIIKMSEKSVIIM
jgi:hypothetical protein